MHPVDAHLKGLHAYKLNHSFINLKVTKGKVLFRKLELLVVEKAEKENRKGKSVLL